MTQLALARQFLGPASALLPWMEDESVTDILLNGTRSAFVEQAGRLRPIPIPFTDHAALFDFIERMLVPLGRRVDAARPYLDGRLADGSRFHLILPPIAPGGPLISIRKSRQRVRASLASFGPIAEWLASEFRGGMNILISGSTGSGKTTLLSRLLEVVPVESRLLVVEETAEMHICHPHCVFLEARPPSPDGTGEVNLRTLIRNALRMRPTRLILGECRGEEAFELLAAMNTGHSGSASTIHANSPLDALRRLETLVLMSGVRVSLTAVREWIASAIQIVVHVSQAAEARTIRSVLRVQGLEGDRYRVLPQGAQTEDGLAPCSSRGFVRDYRPV